MNKKSYESVQEMLDDIHPEFAEDYRKHMKKPLVRLDHKLAILRVKFLQLFRK